MPAKQELLQALPFDALLSFAFDACLLRRVPPGCSKFDVIRRLNRSLTREQCNRLSSEYVATGRYDQTLGDFQFSLPTADDLREVFKRTVLQEMSEDLIVDEVPLRGTRVDVAVFDGSTFAFELKGPRDDVSRVRRQLRSYLRVFEYVSIVVDGHKVPRVPDRVGIIEVRRRSHQWEFETVKNAIENDKTDPVDQLSILTKRELLNLVRNMCGLESLSSRESMIRALTTTLGRAQINELFKDVMRTRVAKTNSPLAS